MIEVLFINPILIVNFCNAVCMPSLTEIIKLYMPKLVTAGVPLMVAGGWQGSFIGGADNIHAPDVNVSPGGREPSVIFQE